MVLASGRMHRCSVQIATKEPSTLTHLDREAEAGPSEEEVTKKACQEEARVIAKVGEGYAPSVLESTFAIQFASKMAPSVTSNVLVGIQASSTQPPAEAASSTPTVVMEIAPATSEVISSTPATAQ
ncbi:uncharacterized protein A4U43_C09F11570 [Asparagus officinalis]|uniref:Uncharacterized protein n=1 Tax=Asparagus officinalis TaxID=4686 RepID=A0A5P1E6U8_ASPOF|nr:uncharacterized protein A4U43_C09F11570 [Asparagus officinalis]